jgi:hypothetical protein
VRRERYIGDHKEDIDCEALELSHIHSLVGEGAFFDQEHLRHRGMLALAKSSGLMPVIDDHQRISKRGNLVFLLARRIGAHRVDVHAGAEPIPSEDRDPCRCGRDDYVSGPGCCLKRPRWLTGDALIGQPSTESRRHFLIAGIEWLENRDLDATLPPLHSSRLRLGLNARADDQSSASIRPGQVTQPDRARGRCPDRGNEVAVNDRPLRQVTQALTGSHTTRAAGFLAQVQPESPDNTEPTVAGCIGVALGLLDDWLSGADPQAPDDLGRRVHLPAGHWRGERAATDILVLASKGRAFSSLDTLIARQGGQHVLYGSALTLAATIQDWAASTDTPVRDLTRTAVR